MTFLHSFANLPGVQAAALGAALVLCCGPRTQAQYPGGANSQLSGSVPSGPRSNGVVQLSLHDAVSQGLRYNLGAIENGEDVRAARGERLVQLSKLLPQVDAGVSEHVQQTDIATLGLKVHGIPPVLGPFGYSSADASLHETLFSYESMQRLRSARTAEQAARLNYEDSLDLITLAVGNAYLQVIEAESRIAAQEAQVSNAKALYKQAADEVDSGTAARIDLTRTEVEFHTEEFNLSVARNNFAIAKLNLSRAIGLPLGQQFDLTDQLPFAKINPPSADDAIDQAYRRRSDLKAMLDAERAAQLRLSAAKGERLPVITTDAVYGDVGETFGHSHGAFTFQAGVRVPIFSGGRVKGDIVQAEAELKRRKAEAENLRGQIDYEVRTAFLNLHAADEQVAVAKQNVDLANENLSRSKDRFSAGVTDSVEVVQAQQALASANDQYITSLYNHNLAKLSLARALGAARTDYAQYLGGE